MSAVPLGSGYDRALDVERAECFARQPKTTTVLRSWDATGFSVYDGAEVGPKVKSAAGVGIKIDSETGFGKPLSDAVGSSGEQPRFVVLARFSSHRETVGASAAAAPSCSGVDNTSSNGVADFVATCGDSVVSEKTYGGHLLLSWRRSPSRPEIDELMGSMLGARTVGATFDLRSNLTELKNQGLDGEELLVEWQGLLAPGTTSLAGGGTGRTVGLMLEYLDQVAQQSSLSFSRVTHYTLSPITIDEVDMCLGVGSRQSSLDQGEWACVYDHLSELVDARDGTGDLAHFEDKYLEARLVNDVLVPAGRVVFNTVPQSRCPNVDADGDPRFEASGPCQAKLVEAFVGFFEACAAESKQLASECRNNVLPNIQSCADFEKDKCKAAELMLSNGTVVTCSEAGMAAAMADMVPWVVNPPFQTAPPFEQPMVFLVDSSTTSLPVTPQTHFCAITGIRGALHEAEFNVGNSGGTEWMVRISDPNPNPGYRPQLEVTCSAWTNFYFANGGSHTVSETYWYMMPIGNFPAAWSFVNDPGFPFLSGAVHYLDEAQTMVRTMAPNGLPRGSPRGTAESADLFPLVSVDAWATTFAVSSRLPASGPPSGGEITTREGRHAGFEYPFRNLNFVSAPLPSGQFCFATGINGRYFSTADWTRIDNSDGFTTLVSSTPLAKDRNPGMTVQCAAFDRR
ncbi:MAG: hypothetical protein QM817_38305 [Archangium sp.]